MSEAAQVEDEQLDDQVDEAQIGAEGGGGEIEDTSSPEASKVATLMGWKPLAQWKGDTANWRPAEDFLAEVPNIMKHTRAKADRVEGQLTRVIAQVAKLDRKSESQADQSARAHARELMEAGDFDGAEKVLTESRAPAKADEPEALTEFKSRNDWYGVDDEATAYVAALDAQMAKANNGVPDPAAHMRKIEVAVKKRFPELFDGKDGKREEAPVRKAPLVNRGNGRVDRSRGSGEMTVSDMSPAQRRGAATMGVSEADWVKSYNQMQKGS